MDQNSKTIVIALGAAVVGGGLVIAGMKMSAPTTEKVTKSAETQQEEAAKAAETSPEAAATAPKGTAPKGTAPKTGGADATDAKLSALLTSSAWCSFSYNQYSGSSSSTRYVFSSNGTFSSGGRAESYSSGEYGTVAGQSDTGGGGQWKIQNQRLLISSADTGYQFLDVNASLSQNSNGYPIITVDGTEFSQCN